MDYSDRVVTTDILLDLVRRGVGHDFNRCLDEAKLTKWIDPDGMHILHLVLPFHQQYKANVDHHRTRVYIKVKGSMNPEEAFLDIADSDWNALVTVDTYKALVEQ